VADFKSNMPAEQMDVDSNQQWSFAAPPIHQDQDDV
jgi:hypothetical protein